MNGRQKLPQEKIMQKLQFLMPSAKLSVRKHDKNEHLVKNPVIRGDVLIDWDESNGECPTLEQIDAVTDEQIEKKEHQEKRNNKLKSAKNDLAIRCAYKAYQIHNPDTKFDEFLQNVMDEMELIN